MTTLLKHINKAAKENDFGLMSLLGKIDFQITGSHLTGANGKVVHTQTTKREVSYV